MHRYRRFHAVVSSIIIPALALVPLHGALGQAAPKQAPKAAAAKPGELKATDTTGTGYPLGVPEFLANLSSAVTASDTVAQLGRSTYRLRVIRGAVTQLILTPRLEDGKPRLVLTANHLLCEVTASSMALATNRGYLTSVVSGVQSVANEKGVTTLSEGLTSLFKDYAVKVADPKNAGRLTKARELACEKDVEGYGLLYFNEPLGGDVQAAFAIDDVAAAIIAVVNALSAVITPILAVRDAQARKAAIIEFFKDEKTRTQLLLSLRQVNLQVEGFVEFQRAQATGQFVDELRELLAVQLTPDKVPDCGRYYDSKMALTKDAKDPRREAAFASCYAALWKPISGKVASLLKVADQYDLYADASPRTSDGKKVDAIAQFKKQLDDVANNKIKDVKTLLETVLVYAGIANTIVTALSPDNRKKVHDAIDGLVKAF